jgi:hypothetical protein
VWKGNPPKLRQPFQSPTLGTSINTVGLPESRPLLRRWAKEMYVAVRRYEGVTDPQKAGQLVDEGFIPIISEMPGFIAYYWVDAGDGVMISTSVFEHKEAEEQSNWQAGDFVAEHLAPLLPNAPQVTTGEVAAYKVG